MISSKVKCFELEKIPEKKHNSLVNPPPDLNYVDAQFVPVSSASTTHKSKAFAIVSAVSGY